jgi:hypothetical protein
MVRLTRLSPTRYVFTAQDGDLSATLQRFGHGDAIYPYEWRWDVVVCGASIDSGAAGFRDARASLIATLEAVAPAFAA